MRALTARAFDVVRGPAPLVFVAPHGGRRDPTRHPWTRGGLRTNDLHTAALTHELAIATAGSALVNTAVDRNDVDLNRVTVAHDHAPRFLEALGELIEAALDRHGHAVVLTIHGWNVVQAIVDIGIGYRPGRHAPDTHPGPTASAAFVTGALGPLRTALHGRGISVALGARYPARARENLLQLFTARYLDDPRPLVRRLARLGRRCEGVQLELGVPLRWPGAWRTRLVHGIVDCVPALLGRPGPPEAGYSLLPEPVAGPARSLEFVGEDLCGLAAFDRVGARLLLFEPGGTLALFTGERCGGEEEDRVGGLSFARGDDGARHLRYEGPLLRFPDTTPFLDLEQGLARATLLESALAIDFRPLHAACVFGVVAGTLAVAGRRRHLTGTATVDQGDLGGRTTQRLALDLGGGERLLLHARAGARPSGYLCRDGVHVEVADARLADPVEIRLTTGERRVFRLALEHRLPVVRGGSTPPVQVEFAACRVAPTGGPAGWRFAAIPPAPPAV